MAQNEIAPSEDPAARTFARLLKPEIEALKRAVEDNTAVAKDLREVCRSNNVVLGKIFAAIQPPENGDGKPSPAEKVTELLREMLEKQDATPGETVERLMERLTAMEKAAAGGAGEAGG